MEQRDFGLWTVAALVVTAMIVASILVLSPPGTISR